jgi:APA family basic amino acid/polyamine antiporter
MIRSLFARKPIEALLAEGENPNGLRRVLGSGDLIMLAIGAVIGAGIFGSIGSAAAGQVDAAGIVRVARGLLRAGRTLLRRAGVDDSPGG